VAEAQENQGRDPDCRGVIVTPDYSKTATDCSERPANPDGVAVVIITRNEGSGDDGSGDKGHHDGKKGKAGLGWGETFDGLEEERNIVELAVYLERGLAFGWSRDEEGRVFTSKP
jgi:hypothetical protein